MKRVKRLSVLLVVLVAVCAAAIAVTQMEERQEQIQATGEIVLEIDSSEVTALRWTYEDTSLAFHKDGTWLYDEDEAFPVDQEKMGELLAPFEAFGVSFVIEEVTDFGMYGLDEALCTISLTTADTEYTISLGDFSELDEERYVSIGDGNVYLAKSDPLEEYDAVLSDLIDQDEGLSFDELSAIRFTGADTEYTITYQEDSADAWFSDDVYFTQEDGKTVPLDTDLVEEYLQYLTTLHLTEYVTYNVTQEELAEYGLDDPEAIVEVDYTKTDEDGETVSGTYTVSVSRDAELLAAAQAAEEAGEEPEKVTGYLRVGDSQIVYRVSETICKTLLAGSYDDLRHREVLQADFDTVTALDITLEGSTYTLAAGDENSEGKEVWTYGESEVDCSDLQSALEALSAASAQDFTVEGSRGQEEIRLTVHLDSEARPETEIVLYRCDGTSCIAEVDGRELALVSRSAVVDLMEAVYAIVLE